MKNVLLLALLSLLIVACNKDELVRDDHDMDGISVDFRTQNQIDICHNGNIISVNINAIPAHQAHGDAVDMDGDGYFDIDNVCGPTDCDDNDPDLNESCGVDCGDVECYFCDVAGYYDFNCINQDPYWAGDYYYEYEYYYEYDDYYCGTPYIYEYGYSVIVDQYNYYSDCEEDTDYGYIATYWWHYEYCGTSYYWSEVYGYLYDYATGSYTVEYFDVYSESEEDYNQVKACDSVIDGWAAELGMNNAYGSWYISGPSGNEEQTKSDEGVHAMPDRATIEANRPNPDEFLPKELLEKLPHVAKMEGLSK